MEDYKKLNVLKLSLPIFFSSILAIAVGYIDTAMLSHYSENSVGAIGNANTIMSFLTLAFTIISSATGILTSQYLGAKRKDKLNQIYTVSIIFNLILSLLVSIILLLFNKQLSVLLNVPKEMQKDATGYIKIVGGFIFTQSIFSTFDQIFRSNGETKIGMLLALITNILNITGNYCTLFGPLKSYVTGVEGVAYSTSFSRIVVLIIAVIYFKYKINGTISLRWIKPFPFDILKKLLALGIPTAGENISYNLSQIVIAAVVNTMGIVAINARIYCNMLCTISYIFSLSLAIGTQIVVGHSVGANDYSNANNKVLRSLRISLLISVSIATLNYFLSDFTLTLFTKNSDIILLGSSIMLISIFLEIGRTTNLIVIQSMKAAGDVKFPTAIGIISMWGISVLLSFILGIVLDLGLIGVWIAIAADEIFRGVIVLIRWINGNWKNKRIVENTDNS